MQRTLSAPSQRLENSISRFDRRPTCPAATTGCYGPPLCIRPIALSEYLVSIKSVRSLACAVNERDVGVCCLAFVGFTVGFVRIIIGFVRVTVGFVRIIIEFVRVTVGLVRIIIGFVRVTVELVRIIIGFVRLTVGLVRIIVGCVRVWLIFYFSIFGSFSPFDIVGSALDERTRVAVDFQLFLDASDLLFSQTLSRRNFVGTAHKQWHDALFRRRGGGGRWDANERYSAVTVGEGFR